MRQKYGFTMFDDIKEFEGWIRKQKITRKVNRLQVHHMGAPDYSCWKTDEHFRRQKNIRDFHKNSSGFSDIAQHFSIFPDGKIMTGRSLNSSPAGITGWNTGAICVEIYGNFDKGADIMTREQKESAIACFAIMCKVFNLPVNSTYIRPHAWFKSDGTYLGTYKAGQSRKTCPGTNFMGYGNTKQAFENFYKDIKNYQSNGQVSSSKPPQNTTTTTNQLTVKIICDTLNVRSGASTKHQVTGKVHKGESYTIVAQDGDWGKLKSGLGWICMSDKYVQITHKPNQVPAGFKNGSYEGKRAKIKASTLNVRSGRGTNYATIGTLKQGQIVELSYCLNNWMSIPFKGGKNGMGYISTDYIEVI